MAGFSIDTVADSTRAYRVLCWRTGPGWAVRLPELDLESSAGQLAEVEAVARALVGAPEHEWAGVSFDIELLPDTLSTSVGTAHTVRADADHLGLDPGPRSPSGQPALQGLAPSDVAAALGVTSRRTGEVADLPPGAAPSEHRAPIETSAVRRAGRPQSGYRHEALLYRGEDEFLAGTVPFIEEALALRQPVMVALPEPRLTLVRAELRSAASKVRMVDMGRLGANPARIIPAWREFVDEACRDGQEARGVAEPLWPGRHPAEVAECELHEALLNLAVEPWRPLRLRCSYDIQRLGTPESEGALCSHPAIVEGTSELDSTGYAGASLGLGMFSAKLPDPPASAELVDFGSANLAAVRSRVAARTSAAGLDPQRAADLGLAVWELAVNSAKHGGGRAALRIWRETDALVCEVTDSGQIDDYLVGRRIPDPTALGQRGLWLVNQLCDLVQLRSSTEGTTARIFTWL